MGSLLLRAFAGLVFLLVVLSVALFVPAGSLRFWQAWVYLGIFAGCSIAITAYLARRDPALLRRRVQAGPVAEPELSQKLIQSLASLCFIALFLVPGFDHRLAWSAVPWPVVVLSDAMVLAGFVIVHRVFRENTFTSAVVEVASNQRVGTTGPYAVVRHPMYGGALVLVLFTSPALGSWYAVPAALAMGAVIVIRLLSEEALLRKELPGYHAYCQSVRSRLIPYLW